MKKIEFVTERKCNGTTYGWFVSFGKNVSDGRDFARYIDGKTTATIEYKLEDLPKYIQKFVNKKQGTLIHEEEWTGKTYTQYRYQ